MAVSYVKFCPRCQTTTPVESSVCVHCGHQFRTQFDTPVSEKTIAMTVAVPASETNPVAGLSRNGHHKNLADRAELPQRLRLRPRRLLILLVTIIAAVALYGGLHISQGRDRIEQGSSPIRQAAFSPYEVVFSGDQQGQPAPIALHDPQDLLRWQMAARPATSNNPNTTDDPIRVHLYLAGKVALILSGTHARVLQEGEPWQRITILDGPHHGLTGYVNRADLKRTSVPSPSSP